MKKTRFFLLFAALFSLLMFSCGSTPKKPADDLTEVVEDTASDVKDAVEDKTDNGSALKRAENARKKALSAGADKDSPELFAAADALYNTLKTQSASGADVSLALKDVEDRFNALAAYSNAKKAKAKIDENGFASYDEESYAKGNEALSDFKNKEKLSNLSGAVMLKTALSAESSYNKVLYAAFRKLAKDKRTEAFKAKQQADGVKAGVAAADDYKKATEEFRIGDSSYSMQNPEAALKHYETSLGIFSSLYESVAEKRAMAQKAIDEAKARVQASGNYAVKADKEAPLEGEKIHGIEAEDTKLLEEDTYTNPEEAELQISADIEDDVMEDTLDNGKSSVEQALDSVSDALNL